MGIRKIRIEGDEILRKTAKPVTEMNLRTKALIRDMFDTMYKAEGVGLAAPQVGILKRLFVIDCSADRSRAMVFINPEILETEGAQTGEEGCLSVPGKHATVTRAMKVTVRTTIWTASCTWTRPKALSWTTRKIKQSNVPPA